MQMHDVNTIDLGIELKHIPARMHVRRGDKERPGKRGVGSVLRDCLGERVSVHGKPDVHA
jgi:hypothetical protein